MGYAATQEKKGGTGRDFRSAFYIHARAVNREETEQHIFNNNKIKLRSVACHYNYSQITEWSDHEENPHK